jgi:hypothetical protein
VFVLRYFDWFMSQAHSFTAAFSSWPERDFSCVLTSIDKVIFDRKTSMTSWAQDQLNHPQLPKTHFECQAAPQSTPLWHHRAF